MSYEGLNKTREWTQVSLHVIPNQIEEMDKVADEMGITRTEFIRQAISDYLAKLSKRQEK
jgi:metal-responsive CopG/Arc/MetJ family transcriptional regulator